MPNNTTEGANIKYAKAVSRRARRLKDRAPKDRPRRRQFEPAPKPFIGARWPAVSSVSLDENPASPSALTVGITTHLGYIIKQMKSTIGDL